MNAMTWWDHETDSLWSQPIGQALSGPLAGTRLDMIAAGVLPWGTWKEEHPGTVALLEPKFQEIRAKGPIPNDDFGRAKLMPNLVIGVSLGKEAKAYPFALAAEQIVINDLIGDVPVLVIANEGGKAVHIFEHKAGGGTLNFELTGGHLTDRETGSVWDRARGFAERGPLKGSRLLEIPYSTAKEWAWRDFYPHSELYLVGGFTKEGPLEGTITSIKPLTVAGRVVVISPSTEMRGILELGVAASVTGRLLDDGSVQASTLEVKRPQTP